MIEMENQLTDAEVDRFLSEPVPFDVASDMRVAWLFKEKWITATAQANRQTPQCNHIATVQCSRCCDCEDCKGVRLSDAAAAFDVEFPGWLSTNNESAPAQGKE